MSCGGEAQFRVEARDSGKRIDYSGVRIESESMNIEVSHQPIEIVLKSKSGCPPSLLACDSCLRPGQFLGHYRRARCVHPASVLPGMRILVMPRALPRLKTLRNALITRASPSLSRVLFVVCAVPMASSPNHSGYMAISSVIPVCSAVHPIPFCEPFLQQGRTKDLTADPDCVYILRNAWLTLRRGGLQS